MQPTVATAGNESADFYDRFYAIKDKQSLQVRKARRSKTLVWDPWPVTKVQKDAIFDIAIKLVRHRNSQCVDICANKIELLPASGNILGVQGGSWELPLYSLRSPDTLPVRFHLWHVAGLEIRRNEQKGCCTKKPELSSMARAHFAHDSKVMVRHGQKSEPLETFLRSFGVPKSEAGESDLCKHYPCWRSPKLTDKWLNDFPRDLRPLIQKRWFSINVFRFLDLPPELREAILVFAIKSLVVERFARSRCVIGRVDSRLSSPNISLDLVSKQVYNEVMPLLFANATVHIGNREQFVRFFRFPYPTPRPKFSERLRILSLDMGPHPLLGLLGVSVLYDRPGYHYIQRHSETNDIFISVCLNLAALKVLKIRVPHIYETLPQPLSLEFCQKAFSAVVWSAAREYIRNIPCVEFNGYVCESQKRSWLEVLVSDRKEVETGTAGDLLDWKRQIWDECIAAIGFARASHYVIKRSRESITDCFGLNCPELWDSKSATKQGISSEYVLLDEVLGGLHDEQP